MTEGSVNLRHEIDSAGDLRSIVRTMKALAASSIGQYEASVGALADYYKTVLLGLNVCLRHGAPGDGSLKTGSGGRPARGGVIVFGSDQGLVGRFNETVSALTLQSAIIGSKNALVWAVGERVHDLLDGAGVLLQGQYSVPASVGAIVPLVGRLLVDSGVDGDIAELWLFYNRPLAGAGYEAVSERLLPLDVDWMRRMTDISWPTASLPEVSGNLFETLRGLIGEYLFVTIFRACAASLASENASRLAAMQRADQNLTNCSTACAALHSGYVRAASTTSSSMCSRVSRLFPQRAVARCKFAAARNAARHWRKLVPQTARSPKWGKPYE